MLGTIYQKKQRLRHKSSPAPRKLYVLFASSVPLPQCFQLYTSLVCTLPQTGRSVGLLRINQVSSASYNVVYQWDMTNCCSKSKMLWEKWLPQSSGSYTLKMEAKYSYIILQTEQNCTWLQPANVTSQIHMFTFRVWKCTEHQPTEMHAVIQRRY